MKHQYEEKLIFTQVSMEEFVSLTVSLRKGGYRLTSAIAKTSDNDPTMEVVATRQTFWDDSVFDYTTFMPKKGSHGSPRPQI